MSSVSQIAAQAIHLVNLGDLVPAARLFKQAWDMDRSNQRTLLSYIRCLYLAKRDKQIIDALDEAKNFLTSPLNIEILRLGLNAANRSNFYEFQHEFLRKLHHLCPSDPDTCIQLSALLMRQQKIDQAESIIKESLALHPLDPGLLTNIAILYSEKGDYTQAEAYYNSVIKVAPRQFLGHYNLARFLMLLGRDAEAKCSLNTCLQIVPLASEAITALRQINERNQSKGGLAEFYHYIEHQDWHRARKTLLTVKSETSMFKYLAAASELRPIDHEALSLHAFLDSSRVIYTTSILHPDEPLVNELIHSLHINPTLVLDRAGKPTVSGFQTHEILADCGDPPMLDLKDRILSLCEHYLESNANPWLEQLAPSATRRISGWGVILRAKGYQKRHVHPEGVISGVVYLRTPSMTASHATREGNLLFSRLEKHEIIPEVGKVVIFPSYLPHETIPINGSEERICIAFNIS